MAVVWTDAQLDAINTRGRDVLVCAAAGSGKTATLTERIIRRLTDRDDPADISRMLIVTFTRNAAAELREKIYVALSEALDKDPSNKHLSLQMMKLPGARISTIHSFCLDVVKRNTAKLGLPAAVTNEAAAESELRAKRVMGEVISDFYDNDRDGAEDFAFLSECITGTKDEGTLSDLLLSLYKKLCSYSGGARAVEDMAAEYSAVADSDFFDSKYGHVYFEELCDIVLGVEEKYGIVIDELSCESGSHPYLSALSSDLAAIKELLGMLETGDCTYSQVRAVLYGISFEKLKSVRKEAETVASRNAKELRSEWKKTLKDKLLVMFEYTAEDISDTAAMTGVLSYVLSRVMRAFEDRFLSDKRDAGVLDYNDLEHYALAALYDGDEPSDVAREIALMTDEIYIDEYQDVNEVQDKIFSAVSNGHNLFMVGDVKQSIYSFRGGEPSIFISRRDSYEKFDRESTSSAPCSIFMQNNFRCDKAVVDFANAVFATLLGEARGRFKYIPEDALVYSKDGGVVSPNEVVPRVVICEGEQEHIDKRFDPEAFWVADEIVRLLSNGKKNDGKSIRPEDIAVLMRSDKAAASSLKAELERRGVPVTTGEKTSPYDNPEVQLIICMLNSIDNPHRDIYLAGVLLSEFYGFTPDELVMVRSEFRDGISLYDSLKCYTEKYGFEKGRAFFESNDRYRDLAKRMPADKLIWQIFTENSFLNAACAKCKNVYERKFAKRHCMFVYDLARSFESGAYRGLYSFVEYLEDMMHEKIKPESEEESFGGCVRIMSMHASKGLEFPVCFVCDTQRSFNRMDLSQKLMYDADIGVGMKIRSEDGIAIVDTPFRRAISIYKQRLLVEEEMRILYVALTRAREKLYITAKPYAYANYEKMTDKARYDSDLFCVNTVSEETNFIDAVLLSIAHGNIPVPCERACVSEKAEPLMLLSVEEVRESSEGKKDDSADTLIARIKGRIGYEYPHARTTRMKAKMSVSKLYPGVLDDEDALDLSSGFDRGVSLIPKPRFLDGEKAADAAERGTATHLIMQFADFEKMEANGVDAELKRLVDDGFIDQRSADIARKEDIERFLESSFYRRIRNADKLWREMRFNLRLDASIFSDDEDTKRALSGEELLVQGVIDGFFLEGESVILFDYKTDHLTDHELSDPEAARKKLSARHAEQLCYYKLALEKMFCRKVEEIYIYSLPLGRELSVDITETVLKKTGVIE